MIKFEQNWEIKFWGACYYSWNINGIKEVDVLNTQLFEWNI